MYSPSSPESNFFAELVEFVWAWLIDWEWLRPWLTIAPPPAEDTATEGDWWPLEAEREWTTAEEGRGGGGAW